ncbi:MAG: DUF4982 domain-containing protein [Acidobacteria bacterium]|nr:DUF4982 domain-containing protein [Acidobacteriota bacterium]
MGSQNIRSVRLRQLVFAVAAISITVIPRDGLLAQELTGSVSEAEVWQEGSPREPDELVDPLEAGSTPSRETDPALDELDRENRPAISFARQFLGLIDGVIDVALHAGPDVTTVELFHNGSSVGLRDTEPWSFRLDLGDAPLPGELLAVARNQDGRKIGRVRQWLNLPRPWAEVAIILREGGDGRMVAHVTYDSVGGETPVRVSAAVNGNPVAVADFSTIALPAVNLKHVHVLRVEAHFPKAGIASREVVFGGDYVHEENTELSSVAVQLQQQMELSPEDLEIVVDGESASVVAIEKGPADLIVVVDPAALRRLPQVVSTVRQGPVKSSVIVARMAALTPGEPGVHLRLLWPVAVAGEGDQGRQTGYRLFPSTAPDDASDTTGLLWNLASAGFPPSNRAVRLADAVAVAGMMAIERSRRRAVLLLHGGSSSEGDSTPAAIRQYLNQLRVPLVVWSLGTPDESTIEEWGQIEVVSGSRSIRHAWTDLLRNLDLQRVVWVEGLHLPQEIELLGPDVAIAGTLQP